MNVTLVRRCNYCGRPFSMGVTLEDFQTWNSGVDADIAFPYLPEGNRRLLKTGMCPSCSEIVYRDIDLHKNTIEEDARDILEESKKGANDET